MKNKVNSLLAITFVVLSACFLIVIVLQYGLIPGIQLPTCCLGEPLEQPLLEQPSWKLIKDETADWETYRNEEYGFEIKHPSDWRKSEGGMGEGSISFSDSENVAGLILWKFEDYSKFKEGIDSERQFLEDSLYVEDIKEERIILDGIEVDKLSYILTQRIPLHSGPSKEIRIFIDGDRKIIIDFSISLFPTWSVKYKDQGLDLKKIEKDFSDIFKEMLSTFRFID
jgi:hypothetical protein